MLNADVNGALGIMLKSGSGNALRSKLSRGVVNTPSRIKLDKIHSFSCKRLVKNIFNQSKPLLYKENRNSGTKTTIEPL